LSGKINPRHSSEMDKRPRRGHEAGPGGEQF
jgi:hypothetical protein